jgi:hypothetical protein
VGNFHKWRDRLCPSGPANLVREPAVIDGANLRLGILVPGQPDGFNNPDNPLMDSQQYFALAQNRVAYYHEYTALELQQRAEEQRRIQERQAEHIRKEKQALDRSRELLLSHLTPEQRKTFEKNQWFVVEGGKTKVKYRINTNTYAGNIHVLAGSKVTHRLCVHCEGVPLHDHHLAQKLWLEHDEERILKIANRQAA